MLDALTLIAAACVFLGVMVVANIADRKRAAHQLNAYAAARATPGESLYDPEEQRAQWARRIMPWLVMALNGLLLCNGFSFLLVASMPTPLLEEMGGLEGGGFGFVPTASQASGAMLVSVLMAAVASILLIPQVRQAIARAQVLSAAFNADSMMHMVALVFCVYLVGQTGLQFALISDFEDLANAISETPVLGTLVLQAILFYAVAVVGVGFPQRRDWRQALARLGLATPTRLQVGIGVGAGLVMLAVQFLVLFVWMLAVGAEAFAEQTQAAEALSRGFDNLIVAFVVAFLTATSEEIIFRGALQPVMGVGITSIVFALAHIQYALTPATLVILALAVVLGILRFRFNTTTAIVAHFVYNFTGLFVSITFQRLLEGLT